MKERPQITKLGDRGVLLRWDFKICPENLQKLLCFKTKIQQELGDHIEVTNTYDSLLVRYSGFDNDQEKDIALLENMDFQSIKNTLSRKAEEPVFEVPVCYDKSFGLDLDLLAKAKNCSISELIQIHIKPVYSVYFIGFLPGFPYLGGMDQRLAHPRKKQPRQRIQQGAVGIAGNQTGIYPSASPAGWQIIGNCPLKLFDVDKKPPSLLKAGDRIKFMAVELEEYNDIKSAVQSGSFKLKKIQQNG